MKYVFSPALVIVMIIGTFIFNDIVSAADTITAPPDPRFSLILGSEADSSTESKALMGFAYNFPNGNYLYFQVNYGLNQTIESSDKNDFTESILNPNIVGYGGIFNVRFPLFFTEDKINNIKYSHVFMFADIHFGFNRYKWKYATDSLEKETVVDAAFLDIGPQFQLFDVSVNNVRYRFRIWPRYALRHFNPRDRDSYKEIWGTSRKFYHGANLKCAFLYNDASLFMSAYWLPGISQRGNDKVGSDVRLMVGMEVKINVINFSDEHVTQHGKIIEEST